ncbi:hypothetical protein EV138_6380 [Kribbella voronezhensis]|uniref:Uncharacterized protein n=1 Tax=Kribbella voronezhensis TaxID=2512212 RepID=A0A4R7SYV9_9ACTN|nr:hypothetical protein [Kribbella voronezhensis]TDU83916.1 hypothetical protein EV138_6380 [Kribbella voronezhensis]
MTAIHQRTPVDEVFLDLVLDDSDLLRAEFDALITACWETPCQPPRRKLCPPVGGWAAPRPAARSQRDGFLPTDMSPARPPRGRQRGPPLAHLV